MASKNVNAGRIANESFAQLLGIELVSSEPDQVVMKLPYTRKLGVGRIHGGAISSLIDVAATAAFWSTPQIGPNSRGATVGFSINFLNLAIAVDLLATATVIRRGKTLSTGQVTVRDPDANDIAIATVTYKLQV